MKAVNKKRLNYLFSFVVTILATIGFLDLISCPEKGFTEQLPDVYFFTLLFMPISYVLFSNILTREIAQDYFLIKDGRVKGILEFPNVLWRWEFYLYRIQKFPRINRISMNASPITENPKVRQIKYNVGVEMKREIAATQAFIDSRLRWKEEEFIKSILYDFNEECSRKLGWLFNPLNQEQQEHFFGLISDFLNPRLAKVGLSVTSATFSL